MEFEELVGKNIVFLPGVEEFDSYPETGMKATVLGVRRYPEDGLYEIFLDYTKFEGDNSRLESLRYVGSDGSYLTFRQRDGYESQESYCVSAAFDFFKLIEETKFIDVLVKPLAPNEIMPIPKFDGINDKKVLVLH
jgi:hypothetical protein